MRPNDSTGQRLRGLLADTLELAQVRLELAGLEAREDAGRLLVLVAQVAVAALMGVFGLVFLALLLVAAFWDTQRLLVLALVAAAFLLGAAVAVWLARRGLRHGLRLFRTSRQELQRDREQLHP